MMQFAAENLISALLEAAPRPTIQAPRDARGLYGLVDHHGDLRYIGLTKSTDQSFFKRIHHRHRTGSEGMSHYFSQMYNTGRMWRDRNDPVTKADGDLAKALRNYFIADHCRAVWLPLPETVDIAQLEAEVLSLAPEHAIAWNRRRMPTYDEPVDLVDATLRRLGWGAREIAAVDRQRLRFLAAMSPSVTGPTPKPMSNRQSPVPSFPKGSFRFFALDVETANNDRGSICQIGVACVRTDNSIETWVTYVDPEVDQWVFTPLHGISARTVQGAPTFADVLPTLRDALDGAIVYQHSGFDRSSIKAACGNNGLPIPQWDWRDSVHVARAAWPELNGNGGHGLASLKKHLGLTFEHHDAGEDARAAAEVVLRAQGIQPVCAQGPVQEAQNPRTDNKNYDPIRIGEGNVIRVQELTGTPMSSSAARRSAVGYHIGTTAITQGNIDNNYLNLRPFIEKFPADAVGGSNRSAAAQREVTVDWGGKAVITTDIDGTKGIFRKRDWIREFFDLNGAKAGDMVMVEMIAPYSYCVSLQRRPP